MQNWKYVKSVDTMERVSRQELADHFDEILDKIDKEKVGVVILDEAGKDGHILCPAGWTGYCFDKDFGCIIISAVRYAIGRSTYMPGIVVDFVRKYLNVLDTNAIRAVIEEIDSQIKWEEVADPGLWLELKKELLARQEHMLKKRE